MRKAEDILLSVRWGPGRPGQAPRPRWVGVWACGA